MQRKTPVRGKVKKLNARKFEIEKGKLPGETNLTIELPEDGDYTVEKLDVDDLPKNMPDGRKIQWFNNFEIKTNGKSINYSVTIPGLAGKTKVVVCGSNGIPTEIDAVNGVIRLTDSDPGIGKTT